jgi:hypothetical protein
MYEFIIAIERFNLIGFFCLTVENFAFQLFRSRNFMEHRMIWLPQMQLSHLHKIEMNQKCEWIRKTRRLLDSYKMQQIE